MTKLPMRLAAASCFLRLIPPGTRGKSRLARFLCGSALDVQGIVLKNSMGDSLNVPNSREPVGFGLLIDGSYEPETLKFLEKELSKGGVFVDVGANVGAFTVPISRAVGTSGRVLAIEASPSILSFLSGNIERNKLSQVTIVHCAAHSHDADEVAFWEAPADHFGMGALTQQFGLVATPVRCRTLDRLITETELVRVDVLKVDVEGFEAAVFRGAERLLTGPSPPTVVFEFLDWAEERSGESPGTAQRILLDWGYQLEVLEHQGTTLNRPLISGAAMIVARPQGK
jgi:FkbM family methyltransferase